MWTTNTNYNSSLEVNYTEVNPAINLIKKKIKSFLEALSFPSDINLSYSFLNEVSIQTSKSTKNSELNHLVPY